MPKKKAKRKATESTVIDVYEQWLAKQPVKHAKGKRGFISAAEAGRELHAGESIGYVITSQRSTGRRFRTRPQELVTESTRYDAGRYVELLEDACKTIMAPFEN